ncbi:MAG: sugar ABC transporter permease [Actinomycetales bacterium]|nr:sugar ABC transporter permease [Actinomycetales bacterium]
MPFPSRSSGPSTSDRLPGSDRSARSGRPVRSGRSARVRNRAAYLFLTPATVLFLAFLVAPICYAVVLSTRASTVTGGGIGVRVERFVGLRNYRDALSDPELWQSMVRLLWYGLIVVPVMLGCALLFALLLDARRVRAKRFSRIAIFLPYAVPGVVATLLWGFLYLPDISPLHDLFGLVGLAAPDPLGPELVIGAVANIAIWGGTGFNMIVLYTSLRAVPSELYDAARIDGCGEIGLATRIKIPLLVPALVMTGIFSLIATLQVYSEPATLRPLTNTISSTWVPLMKVYRDAFVNGDPYLAAATSVVLALGTLVVSLGLLRVLQDRAFGEER